MPAPCGPVKPGSYKRACTPHLGTIATLDRGEHPQIIFCAMRKLRPKIHHESMQTACTFCTLYKYLKNPI
jgi:hypothetical protein